MREVNLINQTTEAIWSITITFTLNLFLVSSLRTVQTHFPSDLFPSLSHGITVAFLRSLLMITFPISLWEFIHPTITIHIWCFFKQEININGMIDLKPISEEYLPVSWRLPFKSTALFSNRNKWAPGFLLSTSSSIVYPNLLLMKKSRNPSFKLRKLSLENSVWLEIS